MDEAQILRAYAAFQDGRMPDNEKAIFQSAIDSGEIVIPQQEATQQIEQPIEAIQEPQEEQVAAVTELPQGALNAYLDDSMPQDEKLIVEDAIRNNEYTLPEGVETQEYARPKDIPGQLTGLKLVKDASIGEQALGAGETALAMGTGATSGAAGQIVGTLKGLAEQILSGEFGTQQAAEEIKKSAEAMGQTFTYEPKTQEGQEMTQAVGENLSNLAALTPIGQELSAVTQGVKNVGLAKTRGVSAPIEKVIPKKAPKVRTPEELGQYIGKISKEASQGNRQSIEALAKEVKANPEAIAAAERLGIELPADILSDSTLIKHQTGLLRSQIGKGTADFADMIDNLVTKADENLSKIVDSKPSEVSAKILEDVTNFGNKLQKRAETLYKQSTNKIPKETEVQLVNSVDTMTEIITELGGIKSLTKQEKSLFDLLKRKNVTYAALERERRQIGQAIGKFPEGKYANADKALLSRVYSSLKKDQLDNIENLLGKEARDKVSIADKLFQKKIKIEDEIVKNFGKNSEGSLTALLNRAVKQGAKGDITALNKAISAIPKKYQKEAILSAFGESITDTGGQHLGKFNFNNFLKTYKGMKQNKPIMNRFMSIIGGDKKQLLDDLETVSQRVNESIRLKSTTGASGQLALNEILAESLMSKVINFTIDRIPNKIGIGIDSSKFMKTPKDRLGNLHTLFKDKDFIELLKDVNNKEKITKLSKSQTFKNFLKASGKQVANPEIWLTEALKQQGESNGNR